MPRSYCSLAVCLVLAASPLPAQEVGQDLREKAPAAWDSLRDNIHSLRVEWRIEFQSSSAGKPLRLTYKDHVWIACDRLGYLQGEDSQDLDENGAAKGRSRVLRLFNDEYNTDLMGTHDDEKWLLTRFKQGGEDAQTLQQYCRGIALPWLLCYNIHVGSWMRDPSFIITRVESLQGNSGDSPVRVHFRCDPSRRRWDKAPQNVPSGHIDLDPAHSYRVTGYEFVVKSQVADGVAHGTLEYEPGDGIPVLKTKIEEEPGFQSQRLGPYSSKDIWTYNIRYNISTPAAEFRLSHYGLPEPAWAKWRRPVPTYVWILLAAGVVGALAVGLRFYVRRRSGAATP